MAFGLPSVCHLQARKQTVVTSEWSVDHASHTRTTDLRAFMHKVVAQAMLLGHRQNTQSRDKPLHLLAPAGTTAAAVASASTTTTSSESQLRTSLAVFLLASQK
jgi:hypothetical protein